MSSDVHRRSVPETCCKHVPGSGEVLQRSLQAAPDVCGDDDGAQPCECDAGDDAGH